MGPGEGPTPDKEHDILRPPFVSPNSDNFKLRKQVALWMTTVKRLAKGSDRKAKGILSALGLILFNALDTVFASKFERNITAEILTVDLDEDEEKYSSNQSKGVQDIISNVPKGTPTDGIQRLVQMQRLWLHEEAK